MSVKHKKYNVSNEYFLINKKPVKVGSITWFFPSVDECCISTINVLPPYRGRGIATKLLSDVIARYPRKRFKATILGGMDNIQSYKLFTRAGFTNNNNEGDYDLIKVEDDLVMVKNKSTTLIE